MCRTARGSTRHVPVLPHPTSNCIVYTGTSCHVLMEPVRAPTAKGANTRCGSSGSMPGFLPSWRNALPRVHRILSAVGKGDYRDGYKSKRHATSSRPARGRSAVFARQRLSRCYKFCTHRLQFLSSEGEFLMLPSGRLPCFEEGAVNGWVAGRESGVVLRSGSSRAQVEQIMPLPTPRPGRRIPMELHGGISPSRGVPKRSPPLREPRQRKP